MPVDKKPLRCRLFDARRVAGEKIGMSSMIFIFHLFSIHADFLSGNWRHAFIETRP